MGGRVRLAVMLVSLCGWAVAARVPSAATATSDSRLAMNGSEANAAPSRLQVRNDIQREQAKVSAATIFPPDTRFEIADTTKPLWRTITLLLVYDQFDELVGSCSGVFLNYNVVLTAAHCIYNGGDYAWSIVAAPGAETEGPPFGLGDAIYYAVPQGWVDGNGALPSGTLKPPSPYDWGIITFAGDPFGGRLAPYPVMAHAEDTFFAAASTMIGTAGFPGDKPFASMWAADSFEYFVDNTYLYTLVDIFSGQSGSPIFAIDEDDFFIFSVVSGGNDFANRSVRFTPIVLNALKQYCKQLGCIVQTYTWVADPIPTPTKTATPTPTKTNTPTATPTKTPTVTPIGTKSPNGPNNARPFRIVGPFVSKD